MKRATLIAICFVTACGLPLSLYGEDAGGKVPPLAELPTDVPTGIRTRLERRRAELETEYQKLKNDGDVFDDKPAEEQTDAEFDALLLRRKEHVAAVTAFNAQVEEVRCDLPKVISRRIGEIGLATNRIKQELERQQKEELPGFAGQYDDWLALDKTRQQEMRARGVGMLEVYFLESLRLVNKQTQGVIEADWNTIWREFRQSPLAKADYEMLYSRLAGNAAAARKWTRAEDFLVWAGHAHNVNAALDGIRKEEYGRATVSLLGLLLHDPKAKILVAETDFIGAVAMAWATDTVARKEVDRILTMQTDHLKAVTSLCANMKSLVDERADLVKWQASSE